MKTRQEVAMKIIKLLNLHNHPATGDGEKGAAKVLINNLCTDHKFRIQGDKLIDIIEDERRKKQQFDKLNNQPKPKIEESPPEYNPYVTNQYVIYKGKKYYAQPRKNGKWVGPPVPPSEYIKYRIVNRT